MPNGSGGWTYEYVIKDHLGNGRVWFAPNAAGTAPVTWQEVHYDPFGFELEGINGAAAPTSPANACHYNGKELNPLAICIPKNARRAKCAERF